MAEQKIVAALKDVSLTYAAGNAAVSKICINLFSSEIVGIAGANGSGKTTLLKILAGYISSAEGQITLDNIPFEDFNERMLNEFLTFVEQNPESQLTGPTIEDELARSCRMMGLRGKDIRDAVSHVLEDIHMTDAREFFIDEISMGEKRRVALGLALLGKPKMLLLDEPLCDLDDAGSRIVVKCLEKLRNNGICVLITSRRLDDLLPVCDRIAVFGKGGTMLLLKKPEEVAVSSQVLQEAGLTPSALPSLMLQLKAAGVLNFERCPLDVKTAALLIQNAIRGE